MRIAKITERYRNDFKFVADCWNCGKQSRWPDGYADAFYCQVVFPDRCCPHCGLNEYGEDADAKNVRNRLAAADKQARASIQEA